MNRKVNTILCPPTPVSHSLKLQHIRLWFKAKHNFDWFDWRPERPIGERNVFNVASHALYTCVPRTCYCDDTINLALGSRGRLHCVSGACYEGEETRREGCIAPLFTQYQIENNVECLWTIKVIVWYFYLNVLLFVWVGNDTFAHWRQLPGSLWAGVCDYDQFWSLAGQPWAGCPVCGSYAQFFVLLCNFEEKPAVLCTYIV